MNCTRRRGSSPRCSSGRALAWLRDWTWHWVEGDRWYASHEYFYLARLPVEGGNLAHPEREHHTDEEVLALREWRWWSVDDLRAEASSTSPVALATLLPALIEHGCPSTPLAIGE